jgi:hypothetical protein
MEPKEWEIVTGPKLIGFCIGACCFCLLLLCSTPGFAFVVDHANLLFHEAGHPAIGLLSQRLEPYGGTFGQLAFPCILAVSFWRKGQAISMAAAVIWFFENWLNIGRYMADARALELPLLGGGDHDWNTIFTRWGILQHDVQIAWTVRAVGWIGMAAACAWVFWRAGLDRGRARQPAAAREQALITQPGEPGGKSRPGTGDG